MAILMHRPCSTSAGSALRSWTVKAARKARTVLACHLHAECCPALGRGEDRSRGLLRK